MDDDAKLLVAIAITFVLSMTAYVADIVVRVLTH